MSHTVLRRPPCPLLVEVMCIHTPRLRRCCPIPRAGSGSSATKGASCAASAWGPSGTASSTRTWRPITTRSARGRLPPCVPAARPLCLALRARLRGGRGHRRPQRRLGRRLEEVAKAVGGGYCRLQMPLELALAVRETVAGHRLGGLEGGLPPFQWGATNPLPLPLPHPLRYPLPTATRSPATQCPPGQKE